MKVLPSWPINTTLQLAQVEIEHSSNVNDVDGGVPQIG